MNFSAAMQSGDLTVLQPAVAAAMAMPPQLLNAGQAPQASQPHGQPPNEPRYFAAHHPADHHPAGQRAFADLAALHGVPPRMVEMAAEVCEEIWAEHGPNPSQPRGSVAWQNANDDSESEANLHAFVQAPLPPPPPPLLAQRAIPPPRLVVHKQPVIVMAAPANPTGPRPTFAGARVLPPPVPLYPLPNLAGSFKLEPAVLARPTPPMMAARPIDQGMMRSAWIDETTQHRPASALMIELNAIPSTSDASGPPSLSSVTPRIDSAHAVAASGRATPAPKVASPSGGAREYAHAKGRASLDDDASFMRRSSPFQKPPPPLVPPPPAAPVPAYEVEVSPEISPRSEVSVDAEVVPHDSSPEVLSADDQEEADEVIVLEAKEVKVVAAPSPPRRSPRKHKPPPKPSPRRSRSAGSAPKRYGSTPADGVRIGSPFQVDGKYLVWPSPSSIPPIIAHLANPHALCDEGPVPGEPTLIPHELIEAELKAAKEEAEKNKASRKRRHAGPDADFVKSSGVMNDNDVGVWIATTRSRAARN